ncbi:MAG: hypothetical protein LHW41_03000 [Candidatus Cloacimonetes bacterium]|nr:hypothetical protein [Candidatus Cloacimonadota bacterium]
MNKYLLSEGDVLERIRKFKFRAQFIPLALVIICFVLALGFGNNRVLAFLALACAVPYAIAFMTHRYRQKILMPEAGSIYAPVSGRVESLQEAGNTWKLTIRKSAYDHVEVRCPYDDCYWEGRELVSKDPRLKLSISGKRIYRITEARMKAGEVIALMIGGGSAVIELPKSLSLLLQEKSVCEAGETRISILNDIAQS